MITLTIPSHIKKLGKAIGAVVPVPPSPNAKTKSRPKTAVHSRGEGSGKPPARPKSAFNSTVNHDGKI